MKQVRCAIYTRKSSDEGLEQSFNSLDAQREACATYILSQASEGWTALAERYDDGGLSGGTLERPALQRLLADVAAGRIDIIVVYKVDRLTRSLFDFAKLVETFDAANISFVSVTQSFNTTTSMGRLTLNMLLSFAQFEREVTAERIRDKIAASKAKGMWMGGTPPIGYRPAGRSLAIVDDHAELVRHLFERYLALGNVRLLEAELKRQNIRLPVRDRLNGRGAIGGGWFTRGQIYKILSNPIYIGRIPHGEKSFAGLHPAIIDSESWDHTQARLADNRQGSRTRTRAASPSLLAGKVVDDVGEPLIGSHASKGTTRYRYYISRSLNEGGAGEGLRIPATELEGVVIERLATALDDPVALASDLGCTLTPASLTALPQRCAEAAALIRRRDRATILAMVAAVRILTHAVVIEVNAEPVAAALGLQLPEAAASIIALTAPVALTRTGRIMRLVQDNGAVPAAEVNAALVRLLVKARRWWKILCEGELDVTALGSREGVQPSYIARVVRLAFLSPAVVEAALKGRLRARVDVGALLATGAVSASWREQERALLPAN